MLKKYKANNLQKLLTYVTIPGKGMVAVTFKPGYGQNFDAMLLTTDKELQDALENSKDFNVLYRLEEVNNIYVKEYEALISIEESKKALDLKKDETTPGVEGVIDQKPDKEPEVIEGLKVIKVKDIQEAKNILGAEPYNVPKIKIPNVTAISNRAAEFGLTFEYEQ